MAHDPNFRDYPVEPGREDEVFGLPAVAQGNVIEGKTNVTVHDGIITAQRVAVPRDPKRILSTLKELANAAGDRWYWSWPVKSEGGRTETISGPTIKLANTVAREYGNCQVDVRAMDIGESWIFYARFVDIETGYSLTRAFQQRKDQKTIKTKDKGRALDIVFQIGQSKAIRNVIANALEVYVEYCKEIAEKNLIETVGKHLDDYRQKVLERFTERQIDISRVVSVIGKTPDEWTARDVARLIAQLQAINEGMATADDLFPPNDQPDPPKGAAQQLDTFSNGKPADKTDKEDPPAESDGEAESGGDDPTASEDKQTEGAADEAEPPTSPPDTTSKDEPAFDLIKADGEVEATYPTGKAYAAAFLKRIDFIETDALDEDPAVFIENNRPILRKARHGMTRAQQNSIAEKIEQYNGTEN